MVPIHDRPLTGFAKMRLNRYIANQRAYERMVEQARQSDIERLIVEAQHGAVRAVKSDDNVFTITPPEKRH